MKTIHNQEYRNIIQNLILLRKENEITQIDLALKMKMSQSDISKIEKCERRLDFIELYNWVKYLGYDTEKFFIEQIRQIEQT